jgi:hypothetical protein
MPLAEKYAAFILNLICKSEYDVVILKYIYGAVSIRH